MHQPTHAIILAAGMGTRLRSLNQQAPKGFLSLGAQPIIEESIARLRKAGIDRITIVTGYQTSFYEELAQQQPNLIETVHNPYYADSGSMYSLYLARARVSGDFLLLESDLIYEQRALSLLQEDPAANILLLSGPTGAGDEVYVEADADLQLFTMSKERSRLGEPIAGELVGITKVSSELYFQMCAFANVRFADTLHLDYETDALVAAGRTTPIQCLTVADLLWSEIDDEAHFRRAQKIHPQILARDGAV